MAIRAHEVDDPAEPLALVGRPTYCRRGGCGELAGADGLCTAHGEHQGRLRVGLAPEPARPVPLPRLPLSRPAWHERAACRGIGPEAFYPPAGSRETTTTHLYRDARKVCETCPVVDECRDAGQSEAHGMWAGESPSERRRARRNR